MSEQSCETDDDVRSSIDLLDRVLSEFDDIDNQGCAEDIHRRKSSFRPAIHGPSKYYNGGQESIRHGAFQDPIGHGMFKQFIGSQEPIERVSFKHPIGYQNYPGNNALKHFVEAPELIGTQRTLKYARNSNGLIGIHGHHMNPVNSYSGHISHVPSSQSDNMISATPDFHPARYPPSSRQHCKTPTDFKDVRRSKTPVNASFQKISNGPPVDRGLKPNDESPILQKKHSRTFEDSQVVELTSPFKTQNSNSPPDSNFSLSKRSLGSKKSGSSHEYQEISSEFCVPVSSSKASQNLSPSSKNPHISTSRRTQAPTRRSPQNIHEYTAELSETESMDRPQTRNENILEDSDSPRINFEEPKRHGSRNHFRGAEENNRTQKTGRRYTANRRNRSQEDISQDRFCGERSYERNLENSRRFVDPRRLSESALTDNRKFGSDFVDPRRLSESVIDPRRINDPRFADPRFVDPRFVDPRRMSVPGLLDPRFNSRNIHPHNMLDDFTPNRCCDPAFFSQNVYDPRLDAAPPILGEGYFHCDPNVEIFPFEPITLPHIIPTNSHFARTQMSGVHCFPQVHSYPVVSDPCSMPLMGQAPVIDPMYPDSLIDYPLDYRLDDINMPLHMMDPMLVSPNTGRQYFDHSMPIDSRFRYPYQSNLGVKYPYHNDLGANYPYPNDTDLNYPLETLDNDQMANYRTNNGPTGNNQNQERRPSDFYHTNSPFHEKLQRNRSGEKRSKYGQNHRDEQNKTHGRKLSSSADKFTSEKYPRRKFQDEETSFIPFPEGESTPGEFILRDEDPDDEVVNLEKDFVENSDIVTSFTSAGGKDSGFHENLQETNNGTLQSNGSLGRNFVVAGVFTDSSKMYIPAPPSPAPDYNENGRPPSPDSDSDIPQEPFYISSETGDESKHKKSSERLANSRNELKNTNAEILKTENLTSETPVQNLSFKSSQNSVKNSLPSVFQKLKDTSKFMENTKQNPIAQKLIDDSKKSKTSYSNNGTNNLKNHNLDNQQRINPSFKNISANNVQNATQAPVSLKNCSPITSKTANINDTKNFTPNDPQIFNSRNSMKYSPRCLNNNTSSDHPNASSNCTSQQFSPYDSQGSGSSSSVKRENSLKNMIDQFHMNLPSSGYEEGRFSDDSLDDSSVNASPITSRKKFIKSASEQEIRKRLSSSASGAYFISEPRKEISNEISASSSLQEFRGEGSSLMFNRIDSQESLISMDGSTNSFDYMSNYNRKELNNNKTNIEKRNERNINNYRNKNAVLLREELKTKIENNFFQEFGERKTSGLAKIKATSVPKFDTVKNLMKDGLLEGLDDAPPDFAPPPPPKSRPSSVHLDRNDSGIGSTVSHKFKPDNEADKLRLNEFNKKLTENKCNPGLPKSFPPPLPPPREASLGTSMTELVSFFESENRLFEKGENKISRNQSWLFKNRDKIVTNNEINSRPNISKSQFQSNDQLVFNKIKSNTFCNEENHSNENAKTEVESENRNTKQTENDIKEKNINANIEKESKLSDNETNSMGSKSGKIFSRFTNFKKSNPSNQNSEKSKLKKSAENEGNFIRIPSHNKKEAPQPPSSGKLSAKAQFPLATNKPKAPPPPHPFKRLEKSFSEVPTSFITPTDGPDKYKSVEDLTSPCSKSLDNQIKAQKKDAKKTQTLPPHVDYKSLSQDSKVKDESSSSKFRFNIFKGIWRRNKYSFEQFSG